MKPINITELKNLQLEILVKFHNFCTKNNLRYFLAYGTLLGAVRHKGYIPWDDDIDIMMCRHDYERLIKIFNYSNIENLSIISPEINTKYYAPYANVYDKRTILIEPYLDHGIEDLGVKIDIFPIDIVPEDFSEYSSVIKKLKLLNYIRESKILKVGYLKGFSSKLKLIIKKVIFSPITIPRIHKKILSIVKEVAKNNDSNFVDVITFITLTNRRFDKKIVDGFQKIEFEGYEFCAPLDTDIYLTAQFGDYLTLPPKEKQIPHHNFIAYWK